MLHLEDRDPALRELYGYWQDRRGNRAMPTRGDIDPAAIPRLLPNILLIDVKPGPRFRYRVVGTKLVERFGRDVTGRHADEVLDGAHGEFVLALYRDVCEARLPAGACSRYIDRAGVKFECSRLVLPLSPDETGVTQLLCIQVFEYATAQGAAAHPPKIDFADPNIRDVRLPAA